MQHRQRILIVDDHPTNVEILEDVLSDDYMLAIATSGAEVLAMAPTFQPDLILLDIMMPGMDGYETCKQLRSMPILCHTKIIMVSAKAMVSERLRGYEMGADDYVTKPFNIEELQAKVRVYLRIRSLEAVDHLKSHVLALLSHETNTPLNGIMGPIQLLKGEPDMALEERSELLDMIYQSAERLHILYQKVLTLSTMKAGLWDFQHTVADLSDIVRSAVGNVVANAAERQVRIDLDLPDAAPTRFDRQQIQRVVTALLENAIRFSPAQTCVHVEVRRDGDSICVQISDQGDGIDADFLPYVFEAFAPANINHHREGHGLSLAIARQIVLAHSGTIEVESTQGAGTTFTVRLPVDQTSGQNC